MGLEGGGAPDAFRVHGLSVIAREEFAIISVQRDGLVSEGGGLLGHKLAKGYTVNSIELRAVSV